MITKSSVAPPEVLARRSPVPVELVGMPEGRLPEAVETAAYFFACEALTNVAKHAEASSVVITMDARPERVLVVVEDDGIGGADEDRGSGLRGLRDRVEALGGVMAVGSPPGRGTQVRAIIPCA